jgi:hypothetical protein
MTACASIVPPFADDTAGSARDTPTSPRNGDRIGFVDLADTADFADLTNLVDRLDSTDRIGHEPRLRAGSP